MNVINLLIITSFHSIILWYTKVYYSALSYFKDAGYIAKRDVACTEFLTVTTPGRSLRRGLDAPSRLEFKRKKRILRKLVRKELSQ